MSLFVEYPPEEPKDPKVSCCDLTYVPADIDVRTWEMVHAYGHSRVPVSAPAMADALSISARKARSALQAGVGAGWLALVSPERHERDPRPRWIGCLPHRR